MVATAFILVGTEVLALGVLGQKAWADVYFTTPKPDALQIQTQAGQFGNAGRNISRGPGATDLDLSLVKDIALRENVKLQFRAESFNLGNHPNFSVPVADVASQNFGRILSAGPARLNQIGLKVLF